jgi:hypothetical protein
MNLGEFKALTDKCLATNPIGPVKHQSFFLRDIWSCFSPELRADSLVAVRRILNELHVRFLCDDQVLLPYHDIAAVLQSALNNTWQQSESLSQGWSDAVALAVECARHYPPPAAHNIETYVQSRAKLLSTSILAMRRLGYNVCVDAGGVARVDEAERKRIELDLDMAAHRIGGRHLLDIFFSANKRKYSHVTDRFNLGRNGRNPSDIDKPHVPWAYHYQIAMKFLQTGGENDVDQAEAMRFGALITYGTAILDLDDCMPGLLFAQTREVLDITRKSLQFDLNYCLTQASVRHVQQLLVWFFNRSPYADLVCANGFTAAQVMKCASYILQAEPNAHARIIRIWPSLVGRELEMNTTEVERLLRLVFAHKTGDVNRKLGYPCLETHVDSPFKPLVNVTGTAVNGNAFDRLPRSLSARATWNAVLQWAGSAWTGKADFSTALGSSLEQFIRDNFSERGIKTHHGDYEVDGDKSECDMVIQTDEYIVFFELKGKQLTRKARSNNTIAALADLAIAVVHPLAQAMTRHAHLLKHGTLALQSNTGVSCIELGNRQVLKVSVCRGELLSLHDRPFLQHFLSAGCDGLIGKQSDKDEMSLIELRKHFAKFSHSAKLTNEFEYKPPIRFNNCWSLSIFQILLMLDNAKSADDFVRKLLRTQRILSAERDLYSLHELLNKISP